MVVYVELFWMVVYFLCFDCDVCYEVECFVEIGEVQVVLNCVVVWYGGLVWQVFELGFVFFGCEFVDYFVFFVW